MTEATLFLPGLSPVGGKTITATFDGGKLSSNGGVLILREIERKLGSCRSAQPASWLPMKNGPQKASVESRTVSKLGAWRPSWAAAVSTPAPRSKGAAPSFHFRVML